MWREAARRLPSDAFAFVMATGILSTALNLVGWEALSLVLLVVALGALAILSALTVTRALHFRKAVASDTRNPVHAFGFLTIVAALNVVGIRLYTPGIPWPTFVLGLISVPVWLALTYGIASNLI